MVAQMAHNHQVAGSNPAPAINARRSILAVSRARSRGTQTLSEIARPGRRVSSGGVKDCPSSPSGRGSGLRNHVMKVRILPGVLGWVGQLVESGVLKTSQSGFESQPGQIFEFNSPASARWNHERVLGIFMTLLVMVWGLYVTNEITSW